MACSLYIFFTETLPKLRKTHGICSQLVTGDYLVRNADQSVFMVMETSENGVYIVGLDPERNFIPKVTKWTWLSRRTMNTFTPIAEESAKELFALKVANMQAKAEL